MRLPFCLILSLGLTLPALSEDVGLGFYGAEAPGWRCDRSLRVLQNAPSVKKISVLYNTFAPSLECAKKFLALPGQKVLEVHTVNEVCSRNRNCGPYEFLSKMGPKIFNQKLAERDSVLLQRLRDYWAPLRLMLERIDSETSCVVSPGLESNLGREAAQVFIMEAQLAFPNCRIAFSPVGNSSVAGKALNATYSEGHGFEPKAEDPCIVNLDGDIGSPAEIVKWGKKFKNKCRHTFVWTACMNGRRPGTPFVDPRARTAWCSESEFKMLGQILREINK